MVLIVVEGQNTEPKYFKAVQGLCRTFTLKIETSPGSDSLTVVNYAAEKKQQNLRKVKKGDEPLYDSVWAVFDRERIDQQKRFSRAVELAKACNINLAVSNPCFEFWLLLHFQKIEVNLPECKKLVKDYLKRHVPKYDKTAIGSIEYVEKVRQAIKHSEDVWKFHNERVSSKSEKLEFPNPSTRVCSLMKLLLRDP